MGTALMVGSEYEVELDIPDKLIWGEHIDVTRPSALAIAERDGDTLLFGALQSFDGKVAELRLGDDLILVEVDRVDCQLPCNVELKVHQLRLFDANL